MSMLFVLFVFIIMSAFFSGIETGFVSFSPLKIEVLRRKKPKVAETIQNLRNNWNLFLSTTLIGNNLAIVGASAVFTLMMNEIFGINNEFVITVVFSLILLLFAESGPKVVFRYYNEKLIPIVIPIFSVFIKIFYPISLVFIKLSRMMLMILGLEDKDVNRGVFVTREELRMLLYQGSTAHKLHREERSLIRRIFDFSQKRAKDIMTPMEKVVFVTTEMSIEQIISLMREKGFSRYPVKDETGKIIGFLHILDVVFLPMDVDWRGYIRPVIYIYNQVPVGELFYHMQSIRANMVIVYGEDFRPQGIITVKDIIDEVVGEVV